MIFYRYVRYVVENGTNLFLKYRNEHPFYLFYSHIINVLLKYSTDYYLNNNGTTNCMKLFSSFHDIIFPIFHFFHKSGFTFITILVMKMQSNCIFSSKYIIIIQYCSQLSSLLLQKSNISLIVNFMHTRVLLYSQ